MAAQHERVDALFLFGERAEGDGAGDVGRALVVLRARVGKAETVRLHGDIRLLSGRIVDDRAVRAVGKNGLKALVEEVLPLGAQALQLFRGAHLRDGLLADCVLEPVDEARDGHAVADVGDALILLLGRVLHRLHELNGAGTVDRLHACANALRDAVIGALAVEQHARTLGE